MRNRISRKLTLVNAIILIAALFIFFILALGIFNNFIRKSIKEQLITENKVTYRLALANILNRAAKDEESTDTDVEYFEPNIYSNLVDSVSIILIQSEKNEEYEIYYSSVGDFNADINVSALENAIGESSDGVVQVTINSTNYFCTMEKSKARGENKTYIAAVSLIPLSSVKKLNSRYILVFLLTAIILVLFSILVMVLFSLRITKPIIKVTNLTKQYAKRDFTNKYIANTNDEIEDLSKSVSEMAHSLEQQDKQRDKMFRNISHELKTPLTAIYGYAEGVKNGVFISGDEPLDIIMSESLRIKKLTEDIIYLSKLESRIEVFKFEKCDISDIMVKAIHSIESIAIMNDIDIRFIPVRTDLISVDEDKIHRALINILSNCVKYTKDLIDIEINDKRDSVDIVVVDNGNGFKEEDIKNLLSGMTKEKSNGSGIGMSIVNEIVKGHGGEFFIGNNKAGGAIFNIVLKK